MRIENDVKERVPSPGHANSNSRVNQVQNDDADCAKPVELESAPQDQLFGEPIV
jgi:hypothetical protein